MELFCYKTPYLSSNCYLLAENGHGVIIDPCQMKGLEAAITTHCLCIDHVYLTHEHVDHIMGVTWCQRNFGPVVTCSATCGEAIKDPRRNHSRYYELTKSLMTGFYTDEETYLPVTPFTVSANQTFCGDLSVQWQGHTLFLHPTPGHSPGSICILVDERFLFTGDTLMNCEKSVCSFVGGNLKALEAETLPWLRGLDQELLVYPGHFESFVLATRMKKNVF